MKSRTYKELYQAAIENLEIQEKHGRNAEIVFVPIVITRNNGKISSVSGVKGEIIISCENEEDI
jgi:hypothetical protein